jgi:hypothetical protein
MQPGAYDEFAPGILANAASRCTESSPFRSATLTCARRCAPSSVHRICCFFVAQPPGRLREAVGMSDGCGHQKRVPKRAAQCFGEITITSAMFAGFAVPLPSNTSFSLFTEMGGNPIKSSASLEDAGAVATVLQ